MRCFLIVKGSVSVDMLKQNDFVVAADNDGGIMEIVECIRTRQV